MTPIAVNCPTPRRPYLAPKAKEWLSYATVTTPETQTTAKENTVQTDKMNDTPGRQPKAMAELLKEFIGKLDEVDQIATFEEQLSCATSTLAAGNISYLITIGRDTNQTSNLHTTTRMAKDTAEDIKNERTRTPIMH